MSSPALECPVCLELPDERVYQCCNGHTLCGTCRMKMRKCPQCRVSFGGNFIRNLFAEGLLQTLEVPCPYQGSGCDASLNKANMERHIQHCDYRSISLCEMIGFKGCTFKTSDSSQLFRNIHQFHKVTKFKAPTKGMITFKDFGNYSNDPYDRTGCTLWEADFGNGNPSRLALYRAIDTAKGDYMFVCLHLGESAADAAQCQMEISIRDSQKQTSKWKWIGQPTHFVDSQEHISYPPFRIPLRYLKNHHVGGEEESDLVWEIAIRKTVYLYNRRDYI